MKKTLLPIVLTMVLVKSISAQYDLDYCPCKDEEDSQFSVTSVFPSSENTTVTPSPILPSYYGLTADAVPQMENIFVIEQPSERINLSITKQELAAQKQAEFEAQLLLLEESMEEEEIYEDEEEDWEEELEEEVSNTRLIDQKRKKIKPFVRVKRPKRAKKYRGGCPIFGN